jgi:hypothetical protein
MYFFAGDDSKDVNGFESLNTYVFLAAWLAEYCTIYSITDDQYHIHIRPTVLDLYKRLRGLKDGNDFIAYYYLFNKG